MDEQREWGEAIAWLLRRLDKHDTDVPPPVVASTARVATMFELSMFERNVLLVCAAVEIDGGVAAALDGGFPSVGLMLGLLDGAHYSAFAPTAPLRKHRLVELGSGPLAAASVRIDERVLYFVLGIDTIDVRLTTGERGALEAMFRTEGIYSSQLAAWRLQFGARGEAGLASVPREASAVHACPTTTRSASPSSRPSNTNPTIQANSCPTSTRARGFRTSSPGTTTTTITQDSRCLRQPKSSYGRVAEVATLRQAALDAHPERFLNGQPRAQLPPNAVHINPILTEALAHTVLPAAEHKHDGRPTIPPIAS